MLPTVETRPGTSVSLDQLPEDPGPGQTHSLCPRCWPNPRRGDRVIADCGYTETAFPGYTKRRRAKPTCLSCLRVINGVADPYCRHQLRRS